jgi:SAM-dependent methyltransferase
MTRPAQLVRLRARYNKNKFFKQRITAAETAVAVDRCPVCDGGLEPVTEVCDAAGRVVLQRAACAPCGFVTFSRMPDGDWFEAFYRSGWDRNRGEESIQQKIEAPYEPLFDILLPRLERKDAPVLEIGSGYGGALRRLRDEGFTVLRGIEASGRRQQVCRDRLGLDVSLVTAEKMETVPSVAGAAPYDMVFSWHVIEHVVDLDRSFAAIARLLRPGGRFVIGVPNFEQEHLIYLAHFLPHIHCFTPHSLTRLLQRHGFEIEYIDDQIRAVARRVAEPPPLPPSAPGPDFPAAFAAKMVRDLDLGRLRADMPFLLDYRFSMAEPSLGTVHPAAGMGAGERLAFAAKRLALGCGHNLRPILHPAFRPANALDPANTAHWLAARMLRFSDMEFGGVVERIEPVARSSGLPMLQVVYPEGHGYGWIK